MEMAMRLQTSRLILFIIVSVILFLFLYNVPINGNIVLENLCLYKFIFGKECINCGMTRACLSLIQGKYSLAVMYNYNSIIVLPLLFLFYIKWWYKFVIVKA